MVWLSYRILRHTCQRPFTHKRFTVRFGTLSLFQSGVCHIHDHGTPLRCTFTAFVSVYPAQVVHPVLCSTSSARYRHTSFAPPVGIHIYRSSFYLFCGSHVGASAGIAAWRQTIPTTTAHPFHKHISLTLISTLALISISPSISPSVSRLLLCSADAPLPL
jgi:hypothetical protein